MILYAARANEYAPPCSEGHVLNTVTLTGAALPDVLTATAETLPECAAELQNILTLTPLS